MMVPDSRLADSEKKEATLCLEDLRQIQPEDFGLPAFNYSKVCVFVTQVVNHCPPFHYDVGDPRDLRYGRVVTGHTEHVQVVGYTFTYGHSEHIQLYSAVSQKLLAEHGKAPDYDFKMKVNDTLRF